MNISRGAVADERAMIGLLQAGSLGSAGLDVYEHEPDVPEALCVLTNVVLAPHMGSGTREALAAMKGLVVANIKAFFEGMPAVTRFRT